VELDPARLGLLGDLGTPEGRQAVIDLFEAYLNDTRSKLSQLAAALEQGDAARVKALAHEQKGASGMVGATRLAGHFAAIEQSPGSHPEVGRHLALIGPALERLGENLNALLHAPPPS
jgi:HPt (histidine-containing phosphotransfer) domain-containing protein